MIGFTTKDYSYQKRVCIVGACGHIGSYLLRNLDENITAVDNFYTQRYCSLFNLPKKINFVESSFQDLSIDFLRQFDVVIHLAAIVNASKSFDNADLVKRVNVTDTTEFINKCDKAGVKKFIFPSSTSVYGVSKDDTPIKEFDEEVIKPQSPYACGKFEVEEYLRYAPRDMEYVICRFGTICGTSPGQRFQTAINIFCLYAALQKPLTVWKEAFNFYRPYLCLSDCCLAIEKILYYNIGNETINILTDNLMLKEVLNILSVYKKFEIEWVDSPLINQYNYKISQSKALSLHIRPNGHIADCIKNTLQTLGNINP